MLYSDFKPLHKLTPFMEYLVKLIQIQSTGNANDVSLN